MKHFSIIILVFLTGCSSGSIETNSKQEVENEQNKNSNSSYNAKDSPKVKEKESITGATSSEEQQSQSTDYESDAFAPLQSVLLTVPVSIGEDKETIKDFNVQSFHEYNGLSDFLSLHVNPNGKVNYTLINKNIRVLNSIIKDFEDNYPTSSWSRNEELAYWVNAYNLYTLKLVSSNYPVSSITKITAKPWDKKFIKLGGNTFSLNDIEHKKIRARYNEPRIHFALNCASESCPKLLNTAFKSTTINTQLTKQTKTFLNDLSKNNFSKPNEIAISALFDWYKNDFVKKESSVIEFINKYRSEKMENPTIKYLDYSWKLND